MDSVISWVILAAVVYFAGIRFAVYVINQYEARMEEMRKNDKWQHTCHFSRFNVLKFGRGRPLVKMYRKISKYLCKMPY